MQAKLLVFGLILAFFGPDHPKAFGQSSGIESLGSMLAEGKKRARDSDDDPIMRRRTKARTDMTPEADDNDTEVAVDMNQSILLGYGGLTLGATNIKSRIVDTIGLRGGWIINERYVIGIDVYTMSEDFKPFKNSSNADLKDRKLKYSQGGLLLQYIAKTHRLWHPVYSLVIGSGGAELVDDDDDIDISSDIVESSNMNVLEPQIAYEFNATKYLRLTFGLGARLTWGGKSKFKVATSEFTSPTILIGINFGNFRY